MSPLLYAPFGDAIAGAIVSAGVAEPGRATLRRFPDGETHVQVGDEVAGRASWIVASLAQPDTKLAPLLLLAATLRDLGAAEVGLIAPYLAYMRQDARMAPGEGITSRYFARLLDAHFDWLLTIDPHLHRHPTLGAIYRMPTRVVAAAPAIAEWIAAHVERPLLLGPDEESEPWVRGVAQACGAPWAVARKERSGDAAVRVELPSLDAHRGCTPVVVDDIASTARTQVAVARQLVAAGWPAPVCIAVHALFVGDGFDALRAAGAGRIVSCDTVAHPTNAIPLGPRVAAALAAWR